MLLPLFLSLMVTLNLVAFSSQEETCVKLDTCTCMFRNRSIVSLWPVDGFYKPSFIIQDGYDSRFYWNPCTPFSIAARCTNVTACRVFGNHHIPAGKEDDTTITVNREGNVDIRYGTSVDPKSGNRRVLIIRLKCDRDEPGNGTIPSLTQTSNPSGTTVCNIGTFTSKFACPIPPPQKLPDEPMEQEDEVVF